MKKQNKLLSTLRLHKKSRRSGISCNYLNNMELATRIERATC